MLTIKRKSSGKRRQISFQLTPEGIRAAYRRLDAAKRQLREASRVELRAVLDEVNAQSTYPSEEALVADVEEAREAIYEEKRRNARP